MTAAFRTTFAVFTSVGSNNSLESLTERSVGLVTDQPSDINELLITLFEQLNRLLHPPRSYIFQRCLSEQLFKSRCKCGARHARRLGQRFDRPGCIHSVVDGTQGNAELRIENGAKPSFVAFRLRSDMRPKNLDKQNLSQSSRDDP